jgi:protein-tyrosine phosphatase
MARVLLQSMLSREEIANVDVDSAGTGASDGVPATRLAADTVRTHGLDLGSHRSKALTPRLIREADLVLAMEPRHAEWARGLAPEARDRIRLLTEQRAEAGAPEAGIADPIGGTAEEYADTFHRIRSHLLRWVPLIREEIERREGVR